MRTDDNKDAKDKDVKRPHQMSIERGPNEKRDEKQILAKVMKKMPRTEKMRNISMKRVMRSETARSFSNRWMSSQKFQ